MVEREKIQKFSVFPELKAEKPKVKKWNMNRIGSTSLALMEF